MHKATVKKCTLKFRRWRGEEFTGMEVDIRLIPSGEAASFFLPLNRIQPKLRPGQTILFTAKRRDTGFGVRFVGTTSITVCP